MADSSVSYTQISSITATEFNKGFSAIQATIAAEKDYYTHENSDAVSLANTKSKLYAQFSNCAQNGVLYKITYNNRLAVISGGLIDTDNYLEERVGFVYPDENGSLAYQYSDAFLSKTDPGLKTFLGTINCVGVKTFCNTNRKLYTHKTALAAKDYCVHTLTEQGMGNSSVVLYQTYY
jgi:hypothetical protein